MKNLCYCLIISLMVISACGSGSGSANGSTVNFDSLPKTTILFPLTEHDFGKIKEGEKVSYSYEYENTGTVDLIIREVKTSCGCTVPTYDKKPLKPGKKSSIKVVFNTEGRPGVQAKTIAIIANTEPQTQILSFTCDVEPKNH